MKIKMTKAMIEFHMATLHEELQSQRFWTDAMAEELKEARAELNEANKLCQQYSAKMGGLAKIYLENAETVRRCALLITNILGDHNGAQARDKILVYAEKILDTLCGVPIQAEEPDVPNEKPNDTQQTRPNTSNPAK